MEKIQIIKKSVYFDSTIPSYYHDNREELKLHIEITKKWRKEEKANYNIFISEATILEINDGDYPNKEKILKLINNIQILKENSEVIKITRIYIDNYLMPKDFYGDALHLAYASYYRIDFLLTWNCNHLANANKITHIRTINKKLKLFIPEIITPLELFKED